mgnify:CR=1 FL=1
MGIKRYTADADNTITNAYKSNLVTRATGFLTPWRCLEFTDNKTQALLSYLASLFSFQFQKLALIELTAFYHQVGASASTFVCLTQNTRSLYQEITI